MGFFAFGLSCCCCLLLTFLEGVVWFYYCLVWFYSLMQISSLILISVSQKNEFPILKLISLRLYSDLFSCEPPSCSCLDIIRKISQKGL